MNTVDHPPDPAQRPRYRRDLATGVVLAWTALASLLVAWNITAQTVNMPDATAGTWVFVWAFDVAALVVVACSAYGLIRGVRVK